MKYGLKIKIDVTKIDKQHLYTGQKGKYLDATVWFDPDNPGQYGDWMITQDVSAPARERNERGAILGGMKIFWTGESQQQQQPKDFAPSNKAQEPVNFDDLEDLPFAPLLKHAEYIA